MLCGFQPVALISSLAVAPFGRFSRSRIFAALLPSRTPVAFFAPLGAFLAGVALFPPSPSSALNVRATRASGGLFSGLRSNACRRLGHFGLFCGRCHGGSPL